jgi:hypothetical protein
MYSLFMRSEGGLATLEWTGRDLSRSYYSSAHTHLREIIGEPRRPNDFYGMPMRPWKRSKLKFITASNI